MGMLVDVGAQGVIGEARLPAARGEVLDPAGRVQADALEHINEVGVGVHALQPAGREQALEDAHLLGAHLAPAEQPVAPSYGDRAQAALQMVGVDRHVRIPQEHLQARPALQRIGEAGCGPSIARG